MFQFTDIPPNATVVASIKTSSLTVFNGPGVSASKLNIKIDSEVQKTRDDFRIEDSQFVRSGKKITKTKEIVTRVFTVRQEITRGMFLSYNTKFVPLTH